MGVVGFFCSRIVPFFVITLALIVGFYASHEQPMGAFFATVFPLMANKLPPVIFGHGKMEGTPPVPDDMMPQPRPEKEMFLELPGGYQMPQNGIGMCCRYSAYDDVLVRRTVLWYLLNGGRLIDTAHLYLNQRAVGLGIKDAMERGIPREEIFVTTKLWPSNFGYNRTKTLVPTFLEELGLEYIDLVLMHFPKIVIPVETNDCQKKGLNDEECRGETYKALSELREAGVMRNVGVSNFVTHHLKQLQGLGHAPIAVNQIQYNPWAPDHIVDTVAYCKEQGIAITAYSSLGGAMNHAQATTVETLKKLAEKYNVSVVKILLRWTLQIGAAVIPGTGNPKHMKENLAAYDFELTPEDMAAIDGLRSDESAKQFFYMDPAE